MTHHPVAVVRNERLNISLFIVSVPKIKLGFILKKRVRFWPTKRKYNEPELPGRKIIRRE